MTHARIASLWNHLALAASGLCLAVVAMPLLDEMPFVLIGYLLLISWSWRLGGCWFLPTWSANPSQPCCRAMTSVPKAWASGPATVTWSITMGA